MKARFEVLLVLSLVLPLAVGTVWGQTQVYVDASQPNDLGDGLSWLTAKKTIQAGVDLVVATGTVNVAAGTYVVPSQINLNKANLTLKGAGSASTIVQVSGTGERFFISASGTTIEDMTIEKTDKTGVQNIIYVGASNTTIRDNVIRGQFVIGDGDVSRAMVVTGGLTGLQIEGNTFYALRQPAYFSGPTTGNIRNNYTYGTKGWVMEGGDMTFTGNTWGSGAQTNVYDIAILSVAPPTAYLDIVAMSNANNEAVIEDQRVSPAVLSIAYADASTSYADNLGGKFHPYSTITPAIARVVAGGTVHVAAGTYTTTNNIISKSLSLIGDPGDALPGPGINAPVVDGGGNNKDAFKINNGVTNVTLKGFVIRNFSSPGYNTVGSGIQAWVGSTSHITVEDNSFLNLGYNALLVGNDKNSDPVKWGDHSYWTVKNNIVSNCGYIGFELTNTSNSSIEDNIIHLATPYIGAIFSSARRSETGLTIKNNLIDGTPSTAFPVIYMYAYDLDMPNPNLNSVLIENNSIVTTGTPAQIYIRDIGAGTITGVHVHNNNLSTLRNRTTALIDASDNFWGNSNGPVHAKNVFNIGSQAGTVTTDGTVSVTFAPWWKDISGTPGSYTGTSFAPITNNDVPSENYSNFTDAIAGTLSGGIVNAAAGTYNESLDISKSLTILGAGQATTFIDQSGNAAAGNVVYIHGACGSVKLDGFTIKTGPASTVPSNGISISGLTGPGTITISHNAIWGVQSATKTEKINYGLIAGYLSVTTPRLVFDHNTVHGGSDNPILIEKWMGPTEITNNTLYQNPLKDFSASDVIFMMNYGGSHNTQRQLISGNTIDMGWGTTNQRGAGITLASSYTGGIAPGGFTDVEISNNTLVNLKPNRRGISTYNNSSDGPGGDVTNAVISGNTISNAIGFTGEFGIRVLGKATGTQILNNTVSGVIDAVRIQPWNGHEAANTAVHNNSLLGSPYGLNNLSTDNVNATCNWWGSTVPLAIASSIHGPAIPVPWLASGVDNETGTPGFQPKVGCSSCNDVTVSISETSPAFCYGTTLTAVPQPAGVYTFSWTGDGTTASKVLTNADPDGDYQVTVTKDNGCTATATYNFAKQNSLSSYVILGLKDVKLGENNIVTGSVGNTAAGKKVAINKNSTVGGFVKASVISLTAPVSVAGGTFTSPAVVTLPDMQLNTAVVPAANYTVPDNGTAIIPGNYNNLTIGKNANVTVNGTIYGTITVKDGAWVTFTAPVIDVNAINTSNGTSSRYTTLTFHGTTVRVKNIVKLGDRNRLISNNITFYMGDLSPDAEKFTVNGNNTEVTANVYMPHGKLNVPGRSGLCTMTGKYIAENIESGNTVTWIGYDCAPGPALSSSGGGQGAAPVPEIQTETEATSVPEIPTAFSLGQNYPNPFNPATTIQFALPTASFTTLKIFNLQGQEVAALVNAVKNAGTYTVRWNAADLPSGVYFYQLRAGSFSETKRLILQK